MNELIEIKGDLFKSNSEVIVQQLNCLCVKGHGLSAIISKKFPYANVYEKRSAIGKKNLAIPEDRGTPGEIVISRPEDGNSNSYQPIVVGLYGQYDYGKTGKSWRTTQLEDNYQIREQWFKE